jgi:hypothetical protein
MPKSQESAVDITDTHVTSQQAHTQLLLNAAPCITTEVRLEC